MKNTYKIIKVDDLGAFHSTLSQRVLLSNKIDLLCSFIIL